MPFKDSEIGKGEKTKSGGKRATAGPRGIVQPSQREGEHRASNGKRAVPPTDRPIARDLPREGNCLARPNWSTSMPMTVVHNRKII